MSTLKVNTVESATTPTVLISDGLSVSGVSTLTGGLKVGTAITMSDNGNFGITGIMTASNFVGGGANVTGVSAANGITDRDAWAISSNYDCSSGSNIISANWYQYADRTSWPAVGSEMTESSGVFTFPKTGLWHIHLAVGAYNANNNSGNYFGGQVYYSSDSGSSYSAVTSSYDAITGNADHGTNTLETFLDITNISTARVKFHTNVPASQNIFGDSSQWRTGAVFTRFGDT